MSYNNAKTDFQVRVARWLARRSVKTWLRLGDWLGSLFYWLPNRRKKVAATNIALCFPELKPAEANKLLRQNLQATGRGVMAMMAALWARETVVAQHFKVTGLKHLREALESGQGCLLLSCHTTTIEWGIRGLNHHLRAKGLPIGHMMARQHNNKRLEGHLEQARLDFVDKLIDKKDLRSLLKSIQSGHPVYYAPDQNFSYQVNFADFFGQPAATTAGTYKLVQRGVLVVPWFCFQTAPDQWQVDIFPPAADWSGLDEQQTANRLNALFESQISRHPEQYLWVHRRFKNQPDGRTNPYL